MDILKIIQTPGQYLPAVIPLEAVTKYPLKTLAIAIVTRFQGIRTYYRIETPLKIRENEFEIEYLRSITLNSNFGIHISTYVTDLQSNQLHNRQMDMEGDRILHFIRQPHWRIFWNSLKSIERNSETLLMGVLSPDSSIFRLTQSWFYERHLLGLTLSFLRY